MAVNSVFHGKDGEVCLTFWKSMVSDQLWQHIYFFDTNLLQNDWMDWYICTVSCSNLKALFNLSNPFLQLTLCYWRHRQPYIWPYMVYISSIDLNVFCLHWDGIIVCLWQLISIFVSCDTLFTSATNQNDYTICNMIGLWNLLPAD